MLGANIRKYRKQGKLSHTELAKKLGVSQQTITAWENEKAEPTSSMLGMVATTFHVSADDLLDRQNDSELENEIKRIQILLGGLESFEGKSVTDCDRKILAEIMASYLRNRC